MTPAPPTASPDTRAPGVFFDCEEHNDLGDNETGSVRFLSDGTSQTACWHIECDKDVVISFPYLWLNTYALLDLYMSGKDSGSGADFTLEKRFGDHDGGPMDVVLSGSAFVQFSRYWEWSRLEFNYVCVDATTQAPPSDVPDTRAPGVNYVCEDHNDLGDNATGSVSFLSDGTSQTACWHIECDKDVVISFTYLWLGTYSLLDLYMSDGTDFTLEKRFGDHDGPMDVVLSGSAFVQFRSTRYWERSRFDFNYVCVDATTQAPPSDMPDTRAPGVNYVCEDHNDLGDNATGSVSFYNSAGPHTECWHIECDKDVVISLTTLKLGRYNFLDLYMSGKDSGNGTDFTLEKGFGNYDGPMDVVLSGSAFLQFRSNRYWGWSRLDFNYVCVDATTVAPPTPSPPTPAPGVNDPTVAPPTASPHTRAPGVPYVCEEHNDLGDNATGSVNFHNDGTYQTACWHIECDKYLVISFTYLWLDTFAYLDLYMSGKDAGNGTDFTLEKRFGYNDIPMDVVLNGSAFVQFRSTQQWERIMLDFNYVCVDATTVPATASPATRAPRVNYPTVAPPTVSPHISYTPGAGVTVAPPTASPDTRVPGVFFDCEDHNDLGDNETGSVSFLSDGTSQTACWHIECDKDVVISFNTLTLGTYAHLDLYMSGKDSGNGTDLTLEKGFGYYDAPMDVVLSGSAFVQFRSNRYWEWSRFDFNYVCVDATTQAPPSDMPDTRAPGVNYVCEEHNDLGDNETGTVSFYNSARPHTECWHIECDKDVVISFTSLTLGTYAHLDLYMSGKDSGNGTDFTLEKRFGDHGSPMDVVLSGSAFVQFRSNRYWERSRFDFNYVCVDATTQAPPTGVPDTRAPGVPYVCEEYNNLGDNATGSVSFQNYDTSHTECWHIECDKDVVISFTTLRLSTYSYLDLYTSGNESGNFTMEKRFFYYTSPMDIVLSGPALVQFRSNYNRGFARVEFNYVCVDATAPVPPTPSPQTRAPGMNDLTVAPPTASPHARAPGVPYDCEEYNDLGDNETGSVSFHNDDTSETACWHIECDKDVVISFTTLQLGTFSYLDLYMSGKDSGNGTDFTLEKRFGYYDRPMDVLLNGSAFVQFSNTRHREWIILEFNYVCVDATTQAPPTEVPDTRAPGVNYVCEEHNDLGDTETGSVSLQNYGKPHTECWHIECDKDVVISFNTIQFPRYTFLDLYMSGKDSGNSRDFTLEKRFGDHDGPMDVVLSGSAFVQFRSANHWEWSRFDFNYVCVDATTVAPPTTSPYTRAPDVNDPTVAPPTTAPPTPAPGVNVAPPTTAPPTPAPGVNVAPSTTAPPTPAPGVNVAPPTTAPPTPAPGVNVAPSTTAPPTPAPGVTVAPPTTAPPTPAPGVNVAPSTTAPPTPAPGVNVAPPTTAPPTPAPGVNVAPSTTAPPTPAPGVTVAPPTTAPPTPAPGVNVAPSTTAPPTPAPGVNVAPPTTAPPTPAPGVTVAPSTTAPPTPAPGVTVAPPTTAPPTPAPGVTVAPSTTAPPTPAPGVNVAPPTTAPPTPAPGVNVAPPTTAPPTPAPGVTVAPSTTAPPTPAPRVTSAPETSSPSVPTTNAPLTVDDVDWCDVDADCRTYDDSAATCVESKCVCSESAGFVNPVTKKTKETLFICVQPTKRGKVKLRLEWNVDCEQSNGAIEGAVRTAIEETTRGRTDTLVVSCGSTIFVVDVEDADITTVATEDMSELIVASLKKNEAAVAAGFATPMTVGSSVVPTLKCSAAGATEMVLVNGGCVALACESGYLLSSGSCVEDDDSDDTLNTGEIVGIVLGCSAFVVIIIAVSAIFLCKGSKAKDTVCHPPHHTSTHCPLTTTFLSGTHRTCERTCVVSLA